MRPPYPTLTAATSAISDAFWVGACILFIVIALASGCANVEPVLPDLEYDCR